MSTVPASPRLPDGIRLRINSHVRRHDEGRVVVGGSPGRLMRLSAQALAMLDGDALQVRPGTAVLAERLLDAGLMDPDPASLPQIALDQMSVVVPVRDRSQQLDRLLAALPDANPLLPPQTPMTPVPLVRRRLCCASAQ